MKTLNEESIIHKIVLVRQVLLNISGIGDDGSWRNSILRDYFRNLSGIKGFDELLIVMSNELNNV